jgi:hypothetical protein
MGLFRIFARTPPTRGSSRTRGGAERTKIYTKQIYADLLPPANRQGHEEAQKRKGACERLGGDGRVAKDSEHAHVAQEQKAMKRCLEAQHVPRTPHATNRLFTHTHTHTRLYNIHTHNIYIYNTCMYVYTYVYTYIHYTYIHLPHATNCLHTHTHTHIHTHKRVYIYIHTYMYNIHLYIYMNEYIYIHAYIRMYNIHTYIQTCIHNIHTYIHTYIPATAHRRRASRGAHAQRTCPLFSPP